MNDHILTGRDKISTRTTINTVDEAVKVVQHSVKGVIGVMLGIPWTSNLPGGGEVAVPGILQGGCTCDAQLDLARISKLVGRLRQANGGDTQVSG